MQQAPNLIIVRRSFITLLEVLISLGLTMLLLTTLSFFYQQMSFVNTRMEVIEEKNFQHLYLQTRLTNLFSNAIPEQSTYNKKNRGSDFYFFTNPNPSSLFKPGTQNLLFSFDAGIKQNKKLSNNVLGLLYVNQQKQLILAVWPSMARWSTNDNIMPELQKEVLMDDVKNLSFEFYVAPDRNRKPFEKLLKKENDGSTVTPRTPPNTANANKKTVLPPNTPPGEQGKGIGQAPNPDPTVEWATNNPQAAQTQPNGQDASADSTSNLAGTANREEGDVKEEKGEEPQPKGNWIKDWKKEYKQLPAMVRVTITSSTQERPLTFTFPLPMSNQYIIYEG